VKRVILFVSFVSILAIVGCRKKGNPYAGLPTSILNDTTIVEILEKEYVFDTINEGDSVVHTFKVKNIGEKNLIIGDAFGSCGCTVPDFPKDPIAPGKIAEIVVRFNSKGKPGDQNKSVTMQLNTASHSEQVFLRGYVIPSTTND
jgi:hypothetical protein